MGWLKVLLFFIPGAILLMDIEPAQKALIFCILIVVILLLIVAG